MQFSKALRQRVRDGEITRSIRIWQQPRVKVGGRYPLAPGEIEVTRIVPMDAEELTDEIARETGFEDLDDLLATAQHGRGRHIFRVDFVYHEAG